MHRMKRGGPRWRGKKLSLMLFALVSTTILMWRWDRTPVLSTFLPNRSKILQVPSDFIPGTTTQETVLSNPIIHHKEDNSSLAEEEIVDNNEDNFHGTRANAAETEEQKEIHRAENSNIASHQTEREVEEESKVISTKNGSEQETRSSNVVEQSGKISLDGRDYTSGSTMHVKNRGCNYAKGKWVMDSRRPLYSGFACKQWLASMWACRLMQREDFTYEKLRWQPKECEMEEFEGSKFLRRMKNKTLAFVGDSLGRQQFQSLMCMITGGSERPDVLDVGVEYGLVTPEGGTRPDGWAYRFPETGTTILYHWSATLCDVEPINATDPATEFAMHLDRPPAFLRNFIDKIHVLVLNTGHHWNRGKLRANKWVMHIRGVPNTLKNLQPLGNAKNFTIHSIISWVSSQLPLHPQLKAFYRTISPRHFFNGDWNTGGSCDSTTPMSIGKEVLQEESSDVNAASTVKGTRVKLLDITALSQVRDEAHISRYSVTAKPGVQDCLHWCLPGVPDTWNELIFAQI